MNFNLYFYIFVFYYWCILLIYKIFGLEYSVVKRHEHKIWHYRNPCHYLFIIIIIINLYTNCGLFTHKLTVKYLGLVLSGFCFCSCHLLFFFSQSNLNCNQCNTFCIHHQLFVSFLRLKYLYALFQASWKVYQNKGGGGGNFL